MVPRNSAALARGVFVSQINAQGANVVTQGVSVRTHSVKAYTQWSVERTVQVGGRSIPGRQQAEDRKRGWNPVSSTTLQSDKRSLQRKARTWCTYRPCPLQCMRGRVLLWPQPLAPDPNPESNFSDRYMPPTAVR